MRLTAQQRQEVFSLYNASETARMLKIDVTIFHAKLRKGFLPPPTVLIGKRKYYRLDDVNRIAQHLNKNAI